MEGKKVNKRKKVKNGVGGKTGKKGRCQKLYIESSQKKNWKRTIRDILRTYPKFPVFPPRREKGKQKKNLCGNGLKVIKQVKYVI